VEANEWSLKILRPRGVSVVLGLPVDGFHFNAFDLVFKELKVRGSLVANKEQVDDMMSLVAKHGVESYITTVPFEKVSQLPELYTNKQLKGRLVLTM
jgi:D-arabinose 1-dehydrogenase-like Zn-dependent alcohol dehydrogenase